MALLSDRDARRWERVADLAAPSIEPRLGSGVLANRTSGPGAVFAPLGPSLRSARLAAFALGRRSEVLIRTDVRSFYPSVTPSRTFRALVDLEVEPELAREAAEMLEGWGSEGYAGLPIGPPGSAVLANAVLSSVDATLAPVPFLRWVDDYLIGLRSEGEVPEVLERLDGSLDRLGLERSAAKTHVCGGGRSFAWLGTSGTPEPSQ